MEFDPKNILALDRWSADMGPYDHMIWVGKNTSVKDIKEWTRELLDQHESSTSLSVQEPPKTAP